MIQAESEQDAVFLPGLLDQLMSSGKVLPQGANLLSWLGLLPNLGTQVQI